MHATGEDITLLVLEPRIVGLDRDLVSCSSCLVYSDVMVVPMAKQHRASRFVTNASDYHNYYDAFECCDVVLAAVDLCCYRFHVLVVTF